MSRVHFYRISDGLWTGSGYEGPESDLALNTPPGTVPHPMQDFPHAMRLVDGVLVDYQPPAPDADHEWHEQTKDWRLSASVKAHRRAVTDAQAQIDALEKQQARAIREERLGRGGTPAELRKRLEDIDDQIIARRAIVNS